MERNVWLHIRGEQEYEGLARERTELTAAGTLEQTARGFLLRYEEAGEDSALTHTQLCLAPERVTLTRTGAVRMELVFARGEVHTSSYALPFGAVPVEVEAQEVRWRLEPRGGLVELRYRIALGGQRGLCALRIRVREREQGGATRP